jgi:hypothetical protein
VAQHFDAKAGALPFSFTYGGRTATELLPAWKLERTPAKRQLGRVQRTLSCTDPATGLRVRCDLTEYDGFPAVEWRIDLEALTRGIPLWHSDMQCSGKPSSSADQSRFEVQCFLIFGAPACTQRYAGKA